MSIITDFKDNAFVIESPRCRLEFDRAEYIIPYNAVNIVNEYNNTIEIKLIDELDRDACDNRVIYHINESKVITISFKNSFDKKIFKENVEKYKQHAEKFQ